MPTLLTSSDLDGIGVDAMRAADARPYVTELVDAVDQDRIADPDDVGYALALAAEIAEGCQGSDAAVALAERRVAATEGTEEHHPARGQRAELLLRAGREDEGMAELEALRPQLTRDATAADWLVEALTENGRAELAEQWLTAAYTTALEHAERADDEAPDSERAEDAWDVADMLVLRRRVVREGLGLGPDAADEAAAELAARIAEEEGGAELVFWPEAAFREVRAALPDEADLVLGEDWDAHRAAIEGELQRGDAIGDPPLVEIATPDLLAAVRAGDDEADVAPGPLLDWPPGRNDACWCGSRTKYKKCCLPRGRAGT